MKTIIVIVLLTFLTGCVSTEVRQYESDGAIYEGTGGSKIVVDGIDFWDDGTPPRKYKIIAIINDTRRDSWIMNSGLRGTIAMKAIEAGGDAIITMGSHSQSVGSFAHGFAHGGSRHIRFQGFNHNIRNKTSKFMVVKYID